MTTWLDLTGPEQSALVGAALSKDRQREVNTHAWERVSLRYPYAHLYSLQLISMVTRSLTSIIYTVSPQGIALLLSAPDNVDRQRIFPSADDIREVKSELRAGYTRYSWVGLSYYVGKD